jgi:hypothetical protein
MRISYLQAMLMVQGSAIDAHNDIPDRAAGSSVHAPSPARMRAVGINCTALSGSGNRTRKSRKEPCRCTHIGVARAQTMMAIAVHNGLVWHTATALGPCGRAWSAGAEGASKL